MAGILTELFDRIVGTAPVQQLKYGDLEYTDKELHLRRDPLPGAVNCTTLQGLVDLYECELDDAKEVGDLLVHITSPTQVHLYSRQSDKFGRRRIWAQADYPKDCTVFRFGVWMEPEDFIIAAQAGFQRVKVETDDGTFAKDLDYILKIASSITAESTVKNDDDGIAQRVAVQQGIVLKGEATLKPRVNLAPYRTFAEIDQPLSTFIFRAHMANGSAKLALFEGDGGRWRLSAVANIASWLAENFDIPVIS